MTHTTKTVRTIEAWAIKPEHGIPTLGHSGDVYETKAHAMSAAERLLSQYVWSLHPDGKLMKYIWTNDKLGVAVTVVRRVMISHGADSWVETGDEEERRLVYRARVVDATVRFCAIVEEDEG